MSQAGSLSASASGGVTPIGPASFTPALAFGGSSAGITYALRTGKYYQLGKLVFVTLTIFLSNKGSATGNATILMPGAPAPDSDFYLSIVNYNNTANSAPSILFNSTSNQLFTANGNNTANMTDVNFVNNSFLILAGSYLTP